MGRSFGYLNNQTPEKCEKSFCERRQIFCCKGKIIFTIRKRMVCSCFVFNLQGAGWGLNDRVMAKLGRKLHLCALSFCLIPSTQSTPSIFRYSKYPKYPQVLKYLRSDFGQTRKEITLVQKKIPSSFKACPLSNFKNFCW